MKLTANDSIDVHLLSRLFERPPLYERSNHYIWTDDHVGRAMLEFHLDPDLDSASLRHEIIDGQTQWITRAVGGSSGDSGPRRLLDIGCGPGLYCERFSALGFPTEGVDFNLHSIEYARKHAAAHGLEISYHLGNYIELDLVEQADVITLINRDFGALTAKERGALLAAVHRALRAGGYFVFDTLSLARLRDGDTGITASIMTDDGFWAAGPHLVLEQTLLYGEADAELERQVVISTDGTMKEFRNWLTYYRVEDVREILARAGFSIELENPFLSDCKYEWPAGDLGFVARKVS